MKSDIGTQKKKVDIFGQIDFFSRKKSFWPNKLTFFSGFQCHFSSRDVDLASNVESAVDFCFLVNQLLRDWPKKTITPLRG